VATILIDDYPQLKMLCFNRRIAAVEEAEALKLYEAGWRFVDKDRLTQAEQAFIERLVQKYGNGVLNV